MIPMDGEGSQERFLARKFLPCIAGFVLVAGIFLVVAGVVVMTEEKTHAAISSLPVQAAPILLLTAGILSLLVGCLGLYYWKKNQPFNEIKKPLKVFMVLLALAALLALVAGSLGVDFSKKFKKEFEADLKEKIGMYGKTGRYETLVNIDRLQKEDKCCGVINYVDWRNTTYGGHRYDKVPDSCCIQEEHACGFEFEIGKINVKGCHAVAVDKMYLDLMLVGVGGIVIGAIEVILCIGFLKTFLREMDSQDSDKARITVSYQRTGSTSQHEMEGRGATVQGSDSPDAQGADEPGVQGKKVPGVEGHGTSATRGKDGPGTQEDDEPVTQGSGAPKAQSTGEASAEEHHKPGAQEKDAPGVLSTVVPSEEKPSVAKAKKRRSKTKTSPAKYTEKAE